MWHVFPQLCYSTSCVAVMIPMEEFNSQRGFCYPPITESSDVIGCIGAIFTSNCQLKIWVIHHTSGHQIGNCCVCVCVSPDRESLQKKAAEKGGRGCFWWNKLALSWLVPCEVWGIELFFIYPYGIKSGTLGTKPPSGAKRSDGGNINCLRWLKCVESVQRNQFLLYNCLTHTPS